MDHCRFRTSYGGARFCQKPVYLEGFCKFHYKALQNGEICAVIADPSHATDAATTGGALIDLDHGPLLLRRDHPVELGTLARALVPNALRLADVGPSLLGRRSE